jgi:hypothetical protein
VRVKELLYWSPKKLEAFYLQDSRWRAPQGEVEVSALGASVRVASPAPIGDSDAGQFSKLARVAKQLTKKAKDLSNPPLEAGDWFTFDYKMAYGRVGNASGEDAAIFFTSGVFKEASGVFLFGSAHHMIGQAPESSPHYTSALDWLGSMAERTENDPSFMADNKPREMRAPWEFPRLALGTAVRRLLREDQLLTSVRLSGLARILLVQPACRWSTGAEFGPLIVGTPLYVEIGPWNPKW